MSLSTKLFGDLTKEDAQEQIITGLIAGFGTGIAFGEFGEAVGLAIGGAIGALKLAQSQGFLTNFLRTSDASATHLNEAAAEATHWYTKLIGDEHGVHINELHIFLASFGGGLALEFIARKDN